MNELERPFQGETMERRRPGGEQKAFLACARAREKGGRGPLEGKRRKKKCPGLNGAFHAAFSEPALLHALRACPTLPISPSTDAGSADIVIVLVRNRRRLKGDFVHCLS
jgi:hypothetical protein